VQLVGTLGVPFVLEGWFGEADTDAMDAEPDGVDDVGMQIDDAPKTHKRARSPAGDGTEKTSQCPRGCAELPCATRRCLRRTQPTRRAADTTEAWLGRGAGMHVDVREKRRSV
jgi:hypothetical protein